MSGAILWASSGAIWRVITGEILGGHPLARAALQCNQPPRRADAQFYFGSLASPPCRLRQLQRPTDDVVFELAVGDIHFAVIDAAAHRNAGGMDGLGIAGHQRMPPVEVLARGEQNVGAGRREPSD